MKRLSIVNPQWMICGLIFFLIQLAGCLGGDPVIEKSNQSDFTDLIPNVINDYRILMDGEAGDWASILPTVQDRQERFFEFNGIQFPGVDLTEIRKKVDDSYLYYMIQMAGEQPPAVNGPTGPTSPFSIWIYLDITSARLNTVSITGVPVLADAVLVIGGSRGTARFVPLDDQGRPLDGDAQNFQHLRYTIRTGRVIEFRVELQEILDHWVDRGGVLAVRIREVAVELHTDEPPEDNVGFGDVYDNGIVHDGTYEIPGR